MESQILFAAVWIIAAVIFTAIIVTKNRDKYGKIPLGWWFVSIGISQICVVVASAVLWKEWWVAHQWIIYVSGGFMMVAVALGIIAKIYGSKY